MAHLLWRRTLATLATQFRQAMAGVAAPAMILTLALQPDSTLHGMTVGSFTLVLVMPTPKVSFNLHLPLYTLDELRANGYCAVHVLPPTERLAQLARQFAKGVKGTRLLAKLAVTPEEKRDGEPFHERTTPFALLKQGEDWDFVTVDGSLRIPILTNCERVFICKALDRMVVDSHELWVAEVVRIIGNLKHLPLGGLLYHRRNFHRVGMPLLR